MGARRTGSGQTQKKGTRTESRAPWSGTAWPGELGSSEPFRKGLRQDSDERKGLTEAHCSRTESTGRSPRLGAEGNWNERNGQAIKSKERGPAQCAPFDHVRRVGVNEVRERAEESGTEPDSGGSGTACRARALQRGRGPGLKGNNGAGVPGAAECSGGFRYARRSV